MFQYDPALHGAVRYNLLTERIDVVKHLWWEKNSSALTDTDVCYFMYYLEKEYGLTSEKNIQKAIRLVADQNRYHPIREYLNALSWDGEERICHALFHFLGAEESVYCKEALQLFMLGAIHRYLFRGVNLK